MNASRKFDPELVVITFGILEYMDAQHVVMADHMLTFVTLFKNCTAEKRVDSSTTWNAGPESTYMISIKSETRKRWRPRATRCSFPLGLDISQCFQRLLCNVLLARAFELAK